MSPDGLAVKSRLWVRPMRARAAVLRFGRGALLRLPAPPVTGSMPETQAVNVSDNAVQSESSPSFALFLLVIFALSILSQSSIVITAFHHGARRAFFMLFLAFQFSHFFSDSRTDDERGKHTNTGWV